MAGGSEVRHTYNGYTVTVGNAVSLAIPMLEPRVEKGWIWRQLAARIFSSA
jgi:hypothetical protein